MSDNRLYPARPYLAASLAVFRDGKVLLAQRFVPPLENRFTLPGGAVELGESLADAALREMHEEVGVEAKILGFNQHVEIVERDPDGVVKRHYVIASFVGTWISGEGKTGPEAQAVIWTGREGLRDLPISADLLPVLGGAWKIAEAAGAIPAAAL